MIKATIFPFSSTSIPEPLDSTPPLFNRITLSHISKLVTLRWVNVPVIESVLARISSMNNDFLIVKFSLKTASLATRNSELNETSPLTINWSPTDKLPFMEVSAATNNLEFNEASSFKNKWEFKYATSSTVKVPWSTMFLETDKLPFNKLSAETKRFALSERSSFKNKWEFK